MCCWLPVRLSIFTLHCSPLSKMMDSTVWSPALGWVWPVGVLVRDGGRKKIRLACLSAPPSVWSLFRLIVSLTSLPSGCFSVCDSLASPSVLVLLGSGAAAALNDPKSRQHPLWLSRLSLTQYRCKYPPDCVHACQAAPVLPDSDHRHRSPPGSSVHRILQARALECVAKPSSRGSSGPRDRTCVSYVSCTGRPVLYH